MSVLPAKRIQAGLAQRPFEKFQVKILETACNILLDDSSFTEKLFLAILHHATSLPAHLKGRINSASAPWYGECIRLNPSVAGFLTVISYNSLQ